MVGEFSQHALGAHTGNLVFCTIFSVINMRIIPIHPIWENMRSSCTNITDKRCKLLHTNSCNKAKCQSSPVSTGPHNEEVHLIRHSKWKHQCMWTIGVHVYVSETGSLYPRENLWFNNSVTREDRNYSIFFEYSTALMRHIIANAEEI